MNIHPGANHLVDMLAYIKSNPEGFLKLEKVEFFIEDEPTMRYIATYEPESMNLPLKAY